MVDFNLTIIDPYNIIFKGKGKRLVIRTSEGEFSILPGFENFITTTIPSNIELLIEDNEILNFNVGWGFLKVSGENIDLCTEIIR